VRYVGEHVEGDADRPADVVVDDPAALVDCPTLRLLVELTLHPPGSWLPPWARTRLESRPAVRWDPPWVDDVVLQYEPELAGKER
jgi:hypothetical protein